MAPADFRLRSAGRQDRPAIVTLAAQIWEGEDYVPKVVDKWIDDPAGQFTVAYAGQQLAGFNKLSQKGPGEWWLEGLRVDPAFRGQGLARLLHEHSVRLARQLGSGMLRLATASTNPAVHGLARSSGFQQISSHFHAQRELSETPAVSAPPVEYVEAGELARVQSWLAASAEFASRGGLFEHRWTFYELLPRLEELIAGRRLLWWEEQSGIIAVCAEEEILHVNYVDAPSAAWPQLLSALDWLAVQHQCREMRFKPRVSKVVLSALQSAGWKVESDYTLYLFINEISSVE